MSTEIAKIVEVPDNAVSATVEPQLSDSARLYAKASRALNTRRAYAAQIKIWTDYATDNMLSVWPANPVDIANWLAVRADAGQSLATVRGAVAAIRSGSSALGLHFDSRHPAIKQVLAGIARSQGSPPKQAEPIRGADIVEILSSLPGDALAVRDGALLALGYVFATRRSELCSLDWQKLGTGDGYVRISATVIEMVLVRSKTSTAAAPETVSIPRESVATAVAAIERWVALAKIQPGEAMLRRFRRGDKSGGRLGPTGMVLALRARLVDFYMSRGVSRDLAEAEAIRFSGHSLRVGFAVSAAEAGVDLAGMATVTRHRSLEMPKRYSEQADKLARSPFNKMKV